MFLISQGEVQLSVRDALSTTGRKIVATVHDGQACHAPLERSLPKIEIHYHNVSTTTVLFGSGRRSPLRAISVKLISGKQAEQTSYEPDSRASLWPARCLAKARSRSGTPACGPRRPSPRRAPRHPHDGTMSWHDHCAELLLFMFALLIVTRCGPRVIHAATRAWCSSRAICSCSPGFVDVFAFKKIRRGPRLFNWKVRTTRVF